VGVRPPLNGGVGISSITIINEDQLQLKDVLKMILIRLFPV
jgi:hypothetical protein